MKIIAVPIADKNFQALRSLYSSKKDRQYPGCIRKVYITLGIYAKEKKKNIAGVRKLDLDKVVLESVIKK